MTGKRSRLSTQQEARISLMEIFIGEIDQLNDNFRVIYLGKYFRKELESIGLYSPHIFRGSELLDVFDTFRNYQKTLPSKTYRSCQTIASD